MATKKAKKTTKKVTPTNKVSFEKSFNSIKETAIKVNSQVLETAEDVAEEIMENSTQIREEAIKTVKVAINKVTEAMTVENVKETANTVNKYSLKTANEIVEGALENGEKWHDVADKALKGSLKLAAKQQDIVFDTLETVKGQFVANAGRLIKLFK